MLKLTMPPPAFSCRIATQKSKQGGVVLIISLIILVALTIAGLALVRSVDTTNVIAGNLAFQQATIHSGEAGSEDAIESFLDSTSISAVARQSDNFALAYAASTPASGNPANWDTYWTSTINPNPVARPVTSKTCVDRTCTLPTDAAGNTVSYTIQRLCQAAGAPELTPTGCANYAPDAVTCLTLKCPPKPPLQYYYRITSRIDGPRNTLSYIQTIVAR